MDHPPIEDSFKKQSSYPSVVERYYSQYHFTPSGIDSSETHCILIHSNRICLVTLAETHPIIQNKKTISKIDFQISEKINRNDNKVSGKGKKGGQFLAPSSLLCFISCSDGSKYTVFSCVKGKLIEINQCLLQNFQLLVEKPLSDGFIAIVLPHIKDIQDQKANFQFCRNSVAVENEAELLECDNC